jgi:hypothetical protein
MKKNKCLGIWMDHSNAFLLELANETIVEKSIISEDKREEHENGFDRHEKKINTKEQHRKSEYYKKLSESIRNYNEVVLFGPTDAKSELLNLLHTDHLFENIKIDMLNSDKMTRQQMHVFVKEYFK